LETCADCRAQVDGVAGDSFLKRMRQAVGANPAQLPSGPARANIPGDESVSNAASNSETPGTADAAWPPAATAKKDAQSLESLGLPPALAESTDYEVIKALGQGGMGIVYLARNRAMDRLEVLKVVSKALLDRPGARERFQQEIRAAARLLHPNIVAAHSVPHLGDLLVFAMEYVDGQDLAQVLKRRGPLPITNATFYAHQAALGLQHAHEKGMVHRDIKPGNLMLAIEGKKHVVKILDFGLAKATSEKAIDGALTKSGQMLGTPDYIAPEQALDAQKADIRADIYSLGCTLYFLLSGHAPFQGVNLMEILLAHHQTHAQPLNLARADVPAELAAIVAKMMAKDPAHRYQTPGEVAKALGPFFKAPAQTVPTAELPPPAPPSTLPTTSVVAAPIPVAAQPLFPIAAYVAPLDPLAGIPAMSGRPRNRTKPKRRRLLPTIAIGLLLLGFIGAAAMIFKFKTADGVVVVKVNVPNPEVLVDGNRMTVTWADGGKQAEIHLPRGSRKIELKKDGFKAFGETVSIENGGQELLAATLEPLPKPAIDRASAGRGPGDSSTALTPPLAIAPFDAAQAKAHQAAWAKHLGMPVETTNSVGAKMILIPPGEFLMGSTDEQVEAALKVAEEIAKDDRVKDFIQKGERPQHRVVITKPFLLGTTEVTIGQFKKFAAATRYQTEAEKANEIDTYLRPGYAVTDDAPAAVVSWNDAVAFCNWLSELEKATYRLPTEAEWEYACRAGTTTQYSFGDDVNLLEQFAWNGKNAAGQSHPVGTKPANAFGLHDMHGNLWEWCQDFWDERWYEKSSLGDPTGPASGSGGVIRGGFWGHKAPYFRSALRHSITQSKRDRNGGFRVVRTIDAPAAASIPSVEPKKPAKRSEKGPLDRRAILDVMPLPVRKTWNNASVIDLARDLRSAYQMNVFVDKKNLEEAGIELDGAGVTWKDARGSLELALKTMLGRGAGWTIRQDVLVITSKARCETDMELVGYKTGPAVTMKVTARPPAAPDPQKPNSRPRPPLPDFVNSVIQVHPSTWDQVGGYGNLKLGQGILLVWQSFQIQTEIERQFPGDLTRIELPATPAPNETEVDRALSTLVSLSPAGEPLDEVLQGLDKESGLQIVIKSTTLEEAGVALNTPCHLELDRVPLRTALAFLLEPFGLTYVVDGKAVLVTTTADAAATLTTSSYDLTKMIAAFCDADAIKACVTGLIYCSTWNDVGGNGILRFSPDDRQLVVTQSYQGTVGVRRLFALVDKAIADQPAVGAGAALNARAAGASATPGLPGSDPPPAAGRFSGNLHELGSETAKPERR
jgi:formylglycine-generating enzyme required for sulfatase activity/serine/threonine protein kinase